MCAIVRTANLGQNAYIIYVCILCVKFLQFYSLGWLFESDRMNQDGYIYGTLLFLFCSLYTKQSLELEFANLDNFM